MYASYNRGEKHRANNTNKLVNRNREGMLSNVTNDGMPLEYAALGLNSNRKAHDPKRWKAMQGPRLSPYVPGRLSPSMHLASGI